MEGNKKRILIVDDDAVQREVLVDTFANAGFEVFEGTDGLMGLELAISSPPQAVISGITMPRMTGFEFFESLKKNVVTAEVPVFFFSHLGRDEDRKHALQLGASGFLVKGMTTPKQMVATVEGVLAGHKYRVEIADGVLDAARLKRDMGCHDGALLELVPDPASGPASFKATFINE